MGKDSQKTRSDKRSAANHLEQDSKRLRLEQPMPLAGKVAVVTGAAGTIGKAIARALLGKGARVVLVGRTQSSLEKAAAELAKGHGEAAVLSHTVDVCEEASVERLFGWMRTELGSCDILVNNAGTNFPCPTVELPAAKFSAVMDTNVLGPFLCAREAFKMMKMQSEGGRIINIGSIAAISPRPDTAAYTASKYALVGLTHSLALDGRSHGIAVGILHPGNVLSDMISAEEQARRRALGEDFMPPEAVADSVLQMTLLPQNTTILELTVMPTIQPLIGRG